MAIDNGYASKLTVKLIHSVSHDEVEFHNHAIHIFCTLSLLAPVFLQLVRCTYPIGGNPIATILLTLTLYMVCETNRILHLLVVIKGWHITQS